MANILSQKTFSIKRIVNGKTLTFSLQTDKALTQIYQKDAKAYAPNYAQTPMTITPMLLISGLSGDQIAHVSNFIWTVNRENGAVATQKLTPVVGGVKQQLKVNLDNCNSITIKCDAIYTEPISLVKTPITASINISKLENTGANILAIAYAPLGDTFVNSTKTLQIHCDLWRGGDIDTTNVVYTWDMLVNGQWKTLSTATNYGVSNFTTNTITVPASAITNVGVFRCSIKDTDSGSATYNKTVSTTYTLYDGTDPYDIAIFQPQGDGMIDGGTLPVWFKVLQGGIYITEVAFLNAHKMRVSRYSTNNNLDTTWGTSGYKDAPFSATDQYYKINLTSADLLAGAQTGFCVELN